MKCTFLDIWSAACEVLSLLHTTWTSWFLRLAPQCVPPTFVLLHIDLFILHLVPFSFFFLSPLIIQQFIGLGHFLWSLPLSFHYLLFSFSNNYQLYILASGHTHFSQSLSHACEFKLFIDPQGNICSLVKNFQELPPSLPPTLQSSSCFSCQFCLLLSILSSSLYPPCISLSLTGLLQSLCPPSLLSSCKVIRGGSRT